jgi:hypothetical protein
VLAALAALALPAPARADGAFPDGLSILLPRDRPHQIILAATFGVVISEDDGATWAYSCEVEMTLMGHFYSVGAAPDHRLHAVSDRGAPVSTDDGCSWSLGGGMIAGAEVLDVFPDPVDAMRVLAIARPAGGESGPASIFRSSDGGLGYDRVLFEAPAGSELTGVETATSAAEVVYATFYETPGVHPRLARSADGGATFSTVDLEPALGEVSAYLVAVDPTDARKLYLRLKSPASAEAPFESLAVSTDGGDSWSVPVTVPGGSLGAFLRRRDGSGTLLLAAAVGTTPVGYRSDDGGRTFADWPLALHVRGLGERGGAIYVASDDFRDGFAVGRSDDGGATWKPLLRFRDIAGVRGCVRDTCQADCDYYAGLKLFPPETCNPPDGGATEGNGGGDGCTCALAHGKEIHPTPWTLAFLAAALLFRPREDRRRA